MDRRLTKIKKKLIEMFDEESVIIEDEKDFQMVEVAWHICCTIEKEDIHISFYSGLSPDTAAIYTTMVYDLGIKEFYISENMCPVFDDKGEYKDMLFGEDADQEYRKRVYNEMRKDEEFALAALTYGPKQ